MSATLSVKLRSRFDDDPAVFAGGAFIRAAGSTPRFFSGFDIFSGESASISTTDAIEHASKFYCIN
jgi:hypothetical protein